MLKTLRFFSAFLGLFSVSLGFATNSVALGQNILLPFGSLKECQDNHLPGCFFQKEEVQTISGPFTYAQHGKLFLTGNLLLEQLKALQVLGVVAVIDIRQSSENRAELENAAQQLGITYQNTPLFVQGTRSISLDAVQEITKFHRAHKNTPHVVGCSSGNRASAWFGAHQFIDHKLTVDAAISAAQEAFLKEDMATQLQEFFTTLGN